MSLSVEPTRKRKRTDEEEEEILHQDYDRIMAKPTNVEFAANYLFNSLLSDIITSQCIQAHFQARHTSKSEKELNLADTDHGITDKLVTCINCQQVVSALKFASHLERCMGLGRNSTRLANIKKTKSYDCGSDNETDSKNWNYRSRKPKKKKKSGHNTKSLKSYNA